MSGFCPYCTTPVVGIRCESCGAPAQYIPRPNQIETFNPNCTTFDYYPIYSTATVVYQPHELLPLSREDQRKMEREKRKRDVEHEKSRRKWVELMAQQQLAREDEARRVEEQRRADAINIAMGVRV